MSSEEPQQAPGYLHLTKIQVAYHPEADLARTFLHGRSAGTVGIKAIDAVGEFGTWDFLPSPHTPEDVFRLLARLATSLADARADEYRLRNGIPVEKQEEGMDTPESTPNQPIQGPPAPPRPKGFQIGRNIHWVNPYDGKHLAGIVAEVVDREGGIANLAVFAFPSRSVWWEEGCVYDPTGVARGSWHYIEAVE